MPTSSADNSLAIHDEISTLQEQLDKMREHRFDVIQHRLYVQQSWPPGIKSFADIEDLINQLEFASLQRSEVAEAEERRQEIGREYAPLVKDIVDMVSKYSTDEQESLEIAHQDSQALSSMLDRLIPLSQRLEKFLGWLTQSNNIPEEQLQPYVDATIAQIEELERKEEEIGRLRDQIEMELRQQDQLEQRANNISQVSS